MEEKSFTLFRLTERDDMANVNSLPSLHRTESVKASPNRMVWNELRTRLSIKEIQKKTAKKIFVFVNLQVSYDLLCILQKHLIIYSFMLDFPEQQHYKNQTLKYINSESTKQRKLAGFCLWHKYKKYIINKYLEGKKKKKTSKKTHSKAIEFFRLVIFFFCFPFGLVFIFYYSDNRCSSFSLNQVMGSVFFFFLHIISRQAKMVVGMAGPKSVPVESQNTRKRC